MTPWLFAEHGLSPASVSFCLNVVCTATISRCGQWKKRRLREAEQTTSHGGTGNTQCHPHQRDYYIINVAVTAPLLLPAAPVGDRRVSGG